MFRRLEPISRSPSPRRRQLSKNIAFPALALPVDTSDDDDDQDDEESVAESNIAPKTPAASAADSETQDVPATQSKRKRKTKRRLTLGKDPGGRWKKRKLQLEEEQIQKALEGPGADGEQAEIFDTIRVQGGVLLRGFSSAKSQSTSTRSLSAPGPMATKKQSNKQHAVGLDAAENNSKSGRKAPVKSTGRKVKGSNGAGLRQTTLFANSFLKEPDGSGDESDTSSLSSLSELEHELSELGSSIALGGPKAKDSAVMDAEKRTALAGESNQFKTSRLPSKLLGDDKSVEDMSSPQPLEMDVEKPDNSIKPTEPEATEKAPTPQSRDNTEPAAIEVLAAPENTQETGEKIGRAHV